MQPIMPVAMIRPTFHDASAATIVNSLIVGNSAVVIVRSDGNNAVISAVVMVNMN